MTKSRNIRKHLTETDLKGRRFGKLTVISEANEGDSRHRRMMECQCDCGKKTNIVLANLMAGRTKSCGCSRPRFTRKNNCPAPGTKFGRLTVVGERARVGSSGINPKTKKRMVKRRAVTVDCDCGRYEHGEWWVYLDNLLAGHVKSCGCLREEYHSTLKENSPLLKNSAVTTPHGDNTTPEEE